MKTDEPHPVEVAMMRLDIWKAAHRALAERDWPADYQIDPRDVLILACLMLNELDAVIEDAPRNAD